MYYYGGRRGEKGNDILKDLESASREVVVRLRDFFENMESGKGARKDDESPRGERGSTKSGYETRGDLVETPENFQARIELPGFSKESIEVTWKANGAVVVRGSREETLPVEGTVVRSTRRYGSFEHVVDLPDGAQVNEEGITAKFTDGVLTITIEKDGESDATIVVE